MPLICVRHTLRAGVLRHTALQDINLTVDKGYLRRHLAFSASTLLRTINGLERPPMAGSRLRGRTFSHFET